MDLGTYTWDSSLRAKTSLITRRLLRAGPGLRCGRPAAPECGLWLRRRPGSGDSREFCPRVRDRAATAAGESRGLNAVGVRRDLRLPSGATRPRGPGSVSPAPSTAGR